MRDFSGFPWPDSSLKLHHAILQTRFNRHGTQFRRHNVGGRISANYSFRGIVSMKLIYRRNAIVLTDGEIMVYFGMTVPLEGLGQF